MRRSEQADNASTASATAGARCTEHKYYSLGRTFRFGWHGLLANNTSNLNRLALADDFRSIHGPLIDSWLFHLWGICCYLRRVF